MLTLTTEAELTALHTGVVKESLHLEYKASEAIDKKSSERKLEMARDVSAFANAADSDDLARVYRFDLAQDSEMISPPFAI